MRFSFGRFCRIAGLVLATSGMSFSALAAEELTLTSDQSQIVVLPEQPSTIVVGNPTIADITSDGKTLFFLGKSFGTTNVIILDQKGQEMRQFKVHVVIEDPYGVAVFKAGNRESYNCRTSCEATMQIGDSATFFSKTFEQTSYKIEIALDQDGGDSPSSEPTITSSSSPQ